MRASQWIVGCVLCIVGIGSAAASSLESQDLDNSPRTASDSSSHDSGSSDRGNPLLTPHGSSSDSTSDTNADRSGGATAPAPNRPSHLGWQSLLPGSIQ